MEDQEKNLETMTRIAWLHYMEGLTQRDIAESLHMSQPKVARLLDKAHKKGIVRVSIESPLANCLGLESRLREVFSLSDVLVVPAGGRDDLFTSLGRAGAWYLERVLKDDDLVGIAWGRTLKQVAHSLKNVRVRGIKVVTLVGGLTASASLNPYTIGEKLASIFTGECYYLYAPAVVESEETRDFYLSERINRKTLELARRAAWSVVGIGPVDVVHSVYALTGFLGHEDLEDLRKKGAVGDIVGQYYDKEGKVLDIPLHRRTVAVSLSDIRSMRNVIAVAGGKEKVEAIRGALRGGFINILVTDEDTAQSVLSDEERQEG